MAQQDAVARQGNTLSRRTIVRGGLVSLLLVGLGGVGLALQKSQLIALPKEGLRVLTPEQYAVLCAIAARICPPKAPGVLDAQELGVGLTIDRMLEYADDDLKAGITTALGIFESGLVGAAFLERTAPFTTLSPELQDRVLIAFRESKVAVRRTIFRSFAGLVGSVYYGDPRVWPSIGYPGPPSVNGLRTAYAPQLIDWAALRSTKNNAPG